MKKHLYLITAFIILTPVLLLLIRPLFIQSLEKSTPKITPTPTSIPVVVVQDIVLELKNGSIVSGPQTISVHQGDTIQFKMTADIDDTVIISGYDKTLPLKKGVASSITFTADTKGSFSYSLKNSKKPLGTLDVYPR